MTNPNRVGRRRVFMFMSSCNYLRVFQLIDLLQHHHNPSSNYYNNRPKGYWYTCVQSAYVISVPSAI